MRRHTLRSRQTGSALIISLLILIVMTLIGITGMGTSGLEEKMAGNDRDAALAFQAAEAALRDGEAYYNSAAIQSPAAAFDGTNAGLIPQGTNPDVLADGTWGNSRTYSGNIDEVNTQPRYIIEMLGVVGDTANDVNVQGYGESSGLGNVTAVRVTARGTGGSDNTVVTLQSNYGRRF
jgi:type IV pilus assembly protein PilX